jgi:hypothetical protein
MSGVPLRETPGWASALTQALDLYGHAFPKHQFALAGALLLPEKPAGASTALVLDALRLLSTAASETAPVRRVVVEGPCQWGGPATNVIECWFNQRENRYVHGGVLKAEYLGEVSVRERIKNHYRHMASNVPLANDNDPDVTESPRYHAKVQSAWVRASAARRGAAR